MRTLILLAAILFVPTVLHVQAASGGPRDAEVREVVREFHAALYTAETHTTGRWRDREIDSHGTESIVLVRTGEGWRIRHIHWSSR